MAEPEQASIASIAHATELLELKVAHEREVRQLRDDFDAKAMELQAIEYERRIETLTREFESFRSEDAKWKDGVSQALAEARGATARQTVIFAGIVTIMAIVFKFLP